MTRRERLRRCYFHEELDRPAVYSRTGFPKDDPTYDRLREYLSQHTELKTNWNWDELETQYSEESHSEPHNEDFERHVYILHTPKGDLKRTHLVSLKGQPGLHETYYINSREDAETFLSLPLPEIKGDVSSFFKAVEEMGDLGIVSAGFGNPAGCVAGLCGSENFAIMTITDRDILYALCDRELEIRINRVKFFRENKIGPYFNLFGEEFVVPPLHGPKDCHDFNVKYDKPIIDLIHENGGRVHIHCHGSIKTVMQGFLDSGADVLHPFEAPPMGDITTVDAKAMARDKICLEGNIQINRMYEATPEEIRQETKKLVNDAFDDGKGLIVCPTASPYIRGKGEECFPQYKAMIDTVLAFER